MFENLKKGLMKKEKQPKKTKGETSSPVIVPVLSAFVGLLFYYRTKSVFPFLLFSLLGRFLFVYIFLNNPRKKDKQKNEELSLYENFYERYFLYSGLENSYLLGFEKAVDTLPISLLRDSLKDFQDNDRKGSIPLQVNRTQSERNLIRGVKERLEEEYEYTYQDSRERHSLYLRAFPKKKKASVPAYLISLSVISVSLVCLFYVFLRPV